MSKPRLDDATGVETVGHEWDGIEELNNPLPRWWLWSFYACIVFAIGYSVVYPAIPMLDTATAGTFGWSSRGDLADEIRPKPHGARRFSARLQRRRSRICRSIPN